AQRQGLGAARARAQAVDVAAARLDPDHVVADAADLLLDLVGRPLADRHAADDGATPMMMPSMVRTLRILLRASARTATRSSSPKLSTQPPWTRSVLPAAEKTRSYHRRAAVVPVQTLILILVNPGSGYAGGWSTEGRCAKEARIRLPGNHSNYGSRAGIRNPQAPPY